MPRYVKDINATLDCELDWTSWLTEEGETVSSHIWYIPSDLTGSADASASGTTSVRLTGGKQGHLYQVRCKIVTSTSASYSQSFHVYCEQL